jgi:predicted enzyme related to lactoylglutathione lyase
MPAAPVAPVGAPIWFDLSSSDPARSRAFYEGLFGWTAHDTPPDFGGYVNFQKGDALIAGLMQNPGQGAPDGWTTYLKSDDAAATAEAITAAGGTVLVQPMAVMGLGTMAIALDPTGGVIGVWQPGTMTGYELSQEAGTPVWHDVQTRDYSHEVGFYEKAFGWTTAVMSDTDEFRYATLTVDGVDYTGIMDGGGYLPPDAPAELERLRHGGVNVVDADVDLPLGGTVVTPAADTQFGRIAKIADPTGGTLRISSLSV